MTANVVLLGLDAAEAPLIERWAGEGKLPNIAALISESAWSRLDTCLETLPGSIWSEIVTGRSCFELGDYFQPRQIFAGETSPRPMRAEDMDPEDFLWAGLSAAGARVAVVDVPFTVETPGLNGVHIREWGLHDRHFGTASTPPELIEEMNAKHGAHASQTRRCDHFVEQGAYEDLLNGLIEGCRRKSAMLEDLLDREHWDVFLGVHSEAHCVGHQFWHFHDAGHPWHDADAPEPLKQAIFSVYAAIDESVGRLRAAAGPKAVFILLASHGMGAHTGGPQLLPEVMVRLGYAPGGADPARTGLRRLYRSMRFTPAWLRTRLIALKEREGAVSGVLRSFGAPNDPLNSEKTKAIAVQNNRCGAVRLNLKGRDPMGSVAPGNEAADLMEEIRARLLELEDPATGEPIIESIARTDEVFQGRPHPNTPDLIIRFRTDLGRLEACRSARIGTVRRQIVRGDYRRTGDHTPQSRLWAAASGLEPGRRVKANTLDIAPTLLALFGAHAAKPLAGAPIRYVMEAAGSRGAAARAARAAGGETR